MALFCDLVGFTSRAEAMDPEDVAALLHAVSVALEARARALHRHRREVHRRFVAERRRTEADEQLAQADAFYRSVGATRYIREDKTLLAAAS
jgi:hypothetical protein